MALLGQLNLLLFLLAFSGPVVVNGQATVSVNVSPADYPGRISGNCTGSAAQFDCGNGTCISLNRIRDCVQDCPDGSDELCGVNTVLCDQNINGCVTGCGRCVATNAVNTCQDSRFANLCGTPVAPIQCPNTSNCISYSWLMDGKDDCGDNWDENPCFTAAYVAARGSLPICDRLASCSYDVCNRTLLSCVCPLPFENFSGDGITTVCRNATTIISTATSVTVSTASTGTPGTSTTSNRPSTTTTSNSSSSFRTISVTELTTTVVAQGNSSSSCVGFCANNGRCIMPTEALNGVDVCGDNSNNDGCYLGSFTCETGGICLGNPTQRSFSCIYPNGLPTTTTPTPTTTTTTEIPSTSMSVIVPSTFNTTNMTQSCTDVQTNSSVSGAYLVSTPSMCDAGFCFKEICCDFDTLGGGNGWTTIQRRVDGSVEFWRSWYDYKYGFGGSDCTHEFWIGNEYLSIVTNQARYELLLQMVTMTQQNLTMLYNPFVVNPETDFYSLVIGAGSGNADDSFAYLSQANNSIPFDTFDRHTDGNRFINCAIWQQSGWWPLQNCSNRDGNLNAPYEPKFKFPQITGIFWSVNGVSVRLQSVEMKIRVSP